MATRRAASLRPGQFRHLIRVASVVQTILGHQHLDHSKPYLTVDQGTLRRAFEIAL